MQSGATMAPAPRSWAPTPCKSCRRILSWMPGFCPAHTPVKDLGFLGAECFYIFFFWLGQVFFLGGRAQGPGPWALGLGPGAWALFFYHSSVGGIISTVGCYSCHWVLSCNHPLSCNLSLSCHLSLSTCREKTLPVVKQSILISG